MIIIERGLMKITAPFDLKMFICALSNLQFLTLRFLQKIEENNQYLTLRNRFGYRISKLTENLVKLGSDLYGTFKALRAF